jgi:hypothetical protein
VRSARKDVVAGATDGVQFAQYLDGLTGERHDVLCTHLHAHGGDSPLGVVEVDFGPFRLSQFALANEQQR